MRVFYRFCSALILCLLSGIVRADDDAHSFIQINWVKEYPDEETQRPEGLGLLLRYQFTDNLFTRIEVEDLSDNDMDMEAQSLVFGFILNPDDWVNIHAALVFEHEDESEADEQEHASGQGLELGLHTELMQALVLHGEASLVHDEEWESAIALGLYYEWFHPLGINVEYGLSEGGNEALEVGFRYSF